MGAGRRRLLYTISGNSISNLFLTLLSWQEVASLISVAVRQAQLADQAKYLMCSSL